MARKVIGAPHEHFSDTLTVRLYTFHRFDLVFSSSTYPVAMRFRSRSTAFNEDLEKLFERLGGRFPLGGRKLFPLHGKLLKTLSYVA